MKRPWLLDVQAELAAAAAAETAARDADDDDSSFSGDDDDGEDGEGGGFDDDGSAVQIDPMESKLKPLGTQLLKPKCDILLFTSAFKFNLGRYTMEVVWRG